jgi:hypothetical protein
LLLIWPFFSTADLGKKYLDGEALARLGKYEGLFDNGCEYENDQDHGSQNSNHFPIDRRFVDYFGSFWPGN